MKVDRREFLQHGAGAAALALGINAFAPHLLRQRLLASPETGGKKKLVYIFLRGGMDCLNAAVPRGDPNYSLAARPTLFLAPGETLRLDGGDPRSPIDERLRSFVELHPAFAPAIEVYQAGHLAVLHRIGYQNHSQSHFDSQQYFENATTDQPNLQEGMLYRQAVSTFDLLQEHFVAFGLSDRQLVALKGRYALPNAHDVRSFRFHGDEKRTAKYVGQPPSDSGVAGRGLLGVYGGPIEEANKPYRKELHHVGVTMAEVMRTLRELNPDSYTPANGAVYPAGDGVLQKAKQAAMLLKRTPVRIVGMNIDGWDTHVNQGKLTGHYPALLGQVASVIQALARDLRDQWNDVVVVVLSEFGRTSQENGSKGTDHGQAIAMLVAGGGVKGGVYNAPNIEAWTKDGGVFSTTGGRYLKHWTDYRAVFAEIFQRHFGDDAQTLNRVIPKHDALCAASPGEYAKLGFLS